MVTGNEELKEKQRQIAPAFDALIEARSRRDDVGYAEAMRRVFTERPDLHAFYQHSVRGKK